MNESQELFQKLQKDTKGFLFLSEYLRQNVGISMPLNSKNQCLMASRLARLIRDYSINSYSQLYTRIQKGEVSLQKEFIMALTTNTTHFFREEKHYGVLYDWLERFSKLNKKDDDVRIWCAAASSGQEPYSIAMTCESFKELHFDFNYRILATDIDLKILSKALRGEYLPSEVKNISDELISKYFNVVETSVSEKRYQVKKHISNAITFAPFNLREEHYPFKKKFHCIFVRNVFIYFDHSLIQQILNNMAEYLYPGGLLFLGHSESGTMKSPYYSMIEHAVYKRL